MRYDGQYINVKRMGLALEGLIRRDYPGDWLRFIEIYSFAKLVEPGRIVNLMPKPVTLYDPVVQLRADMSRDDISEHQVPPHFTNLQHGLSMARRLLANVDTPNKQIVLITDGLPTAHFEGQMLYLLYPPDPRTEQATMREGAACHREGNHHQHVPPPQLVAVGGGCAIRLPLSGIDHWPRLFHRRPRPRPLRRLGLPQPPPRTSPLVLATNQNNRQDAKNAKSSLGFLALNLASLASWRSNSFAVSTSMRQNMPEIPE
jgi:hypothetical protein